MKRKPHAQFHLPPLSPDDALLVVHLLDRIGSAIWRAHGPQMAHRLRQLHASRPIAAGRVGHPAATADDDSPL